MTPCTLGGLGVVHLFRILSILWTFIHGHWHWQHSSMDMSKFPSSTTSYPSSSHAINCASLVLSARNLYKAWSHIGTRWLAFTSLDGEALDVYDILYSANFRCRLRLSIFRSSQRESTEEEITTLSDFSVNAGFNIIVFMQLRTKQQQHC